MRKFPTANQINKRTVKTRLFSGGILNRGPHFCCRGFGSDGLDARLNKLPWSATLRSLMWALSLKKSVNYQNFEEKIVSSEWEIKSEKRSM